MESANSPATGVFVYEFHSGDFDFRWVNFGNKNSFSNTVIDPKILHAIISIVYILSLMPHEKIGGCFPIVVKL